ncbi:hypothetical protein G5727_002781 [Listeria monocytogenes]|nr:hypothetical protein [Listeria monocytogenes]HBI6117713.1 hypothetical protein [Listeria monocytogenes]
MNSGDNEDVNDRDKLTSSKNMVPYHHESLPASVENELDHINRNIFEKVRAKMYDRKIFLVTQHFEQRDGKMILITKNVETKKTGSKDRRKG